MVENSVYGCWNVEIKKRPMCEVAVSKVSRDFGQRVGTGPERIQEMPSSLCISLKSRNHQRVMIRV